MAEQQITKRRVTMRSIRLAADGATITEEAVDYVPEDIVDLYISEAQQRWQSVTVSDEPDAGPAGLDGLTVIPEQLAHPEAGNVYEGQSRVPVATMAELRELFPDGAPRETEA